MLYFSKKSNTKPCTISGILIFDDALNIAGTCYRTGDQTHTHKNLKDQFGLKDMIGNYVKLQIKVKKENNNRGANCEWEQAIVNRWVDSGYQT
jgi:hypothetical protein